jgi:hypothetical protein
METIDLAAIWRTAATTSYLVSRQWPEASGEELAEVCHHIHQIAFRLTVAERHIDNNVALVLDELRQRDIVPPWV